MQFHMVYLSVHFSIIQRGILVLSINAVRSSLTCVSLLVSSARGLFFRTLFYEAPAVFFTSRQLLNS